MTHTAFRYRIPNTALTNREREMLQRFNEGQRYADIALRMGVTVGTVNKTVQRAKDKLADLAWVTS